MAHGTCMSRNKRKPVVKCVSNNTIIMFMQSFSMDDNLKFVVTRESPEYNESTMQTILTALLFMYEVNTVLYWHPNMLVKVGSDTFSN